MTKVAYSPGSVGNYVTYAELADLESSKVKLFNRYVGSFSAEECGSADVVIYTSFGEYKDFATFEFIKSHFKNKFVVFVTRQQYLGVPESGSDYKIIKVPTAHSLYSTWIPHQSMQVDQRMFDKVFLSLNYRASWDRQAMAQFVLSHDLMNKMYFSYHCGDRFLIGKRTLYDTINSQIGESRTWFNHTIDYEEMYNQLPIFNGLEELHKVNDWSFGHKDYYEKTFCSVVSETYTDDNADPFFTEKMFKPMAYAHPFMVFCSANSLQLLKSLGFETFGDILDESYDTIENPQMRLETIFREMLRISNLDNKELQNMYSKVVPTLKHNYNVFWNELPNKYKKDIQLVKEEIQSLIEKI